MLAEQMRFSVPWTDPLSKMRVDGVNERRGETKKLPKIHTIHFQALVLWVPEEVFYKIILYSSPGLEIYQWSRLSRLDQENRTHLESLKVRPFFPEM